MLKPYEEQDCFECGSPYNPESQFCEYCGAEIVHRCSLEKQRNYFENLSIEISAQLIQQYPDPNRNRRDLLEVFMFEHQIISNETLYDRRIFMSYVLRRNKAHYDFLEETGKQSPLERFIRFLKQKRSVLP